MRNDGIGDGSGEGDSGPDSGSEPRESHSDSASGSDPVSGVESSGPGARSESDAVSGARSDRDAGSGAVSGREARSGAGSEPGSAVGDSEAGGGGSASGSGAGRPRVALIGIGLGLLSSISYATVNALLRSVAGEVDPFTGALIRQLPLVAALALLALVLRPRAMRPRAPEFIGPKLALTLLAGGVVSLFVGNALLFWALDWVGLGIATAAYLGGLLLGSALIGRVFLGERPARSELVGIAFIVIGLVVTAVSAQGAAGRGEGAGPGIAVLGFAFAVVTGVCYATSNSLARVSQQVPGRFVVTLSLITLGGVLGLVLFITILHGGKLSEAFTELTGHQALVLVLAGCANGVALVSITIAVRYTTVTTVSMLNALVIVFGVLFGNWFFAEPITATLVTGSACILAGVVIGQIRWRRRDSSTLARRPDGA